MIEFVIKRDNRKVKFNQKKITKAIQLAANAVAKDNQEEPNPVISEKLTDIILNKIENKYNTIIPTVEDVQELIIESLMEDGHYRTAEKYILYREERSKIRDRKSALMQKIEEITFVDATQSNLKRDNANVNGNTAMGQMLQYGAIVSKQFTDDNLLREDIEKSVKSGDIYVHDKDFFPMGTPTCSQIDLNKLFKNGFNTGHGTLREPQDIMSYGALAAIAIQANQNDNHGGQSIPMFDYYLAPGVKKTFRKSFIKNLSYILDDNYNLNLEETELLKDLLKNTDIRFKTNVETVNSEIKNILFSYFSEINNKNVDALICKARERTNKEVIKKTYQTMEAFVHNLNTMHSRAGAQVPFSSVNFGTDISEEGKLVSEQLMLAQEAGLGNGETPIFPILIFKVKEGVNYNPEDPNYDLFQLAIRVTAKRLFPNFVFIDAPFNLQYYKKGNPETEIATMGCRTRVMGNINGEETCIGRGNLSFNTINLPRLGIKYGIVGKKHIFDKKGFFKDLDKKIDLCIDALLERYEIQKSKKVKNFPFCYGQGVWKGPDKLQMNDVVGDTINQGTLSVGFIGLAECLKALIGKHHGESDEAQELGLEIVSFIRKRMDEATEKYHLNFSVLATPAEGLSGYFTRIDRKKYGVIDGVTDKDYYTNSNHIPVYYNISAFNKIQKEAPYHALTNAGHIAYVELDGDPSNNLEALESIIRCMKESGIGYGSINHPVDRDPVCGYSGIIEGNICPCCGRDVSKKIVKKEKIKRF